ncbi:MAG: hypothetical protein PWQ35_103 [Patescibacteria group bacterium]|nr:hypothetical protein [Patescibacteria group bacterium]
MKSQLEIKPIAHLIDCNANPSTPAGWLFEEHKRNGLFEFDPAKVFLYLSEKQKKGTISGYDLRKELRNKPVMNANVLDYLLAHIELIPEEWKGKFVYFWGTIYRYSIDSLYVRCLLWDSYNLEWRCCYIWLNYKFNSNDFAALII